MARLPPEALLARAAEAVMARVRADGERVDFPGRALFHYLEKHLFETDLTIEAWRRACKIQGGPALFRVQAVIGTTLGVYLEELRVETAMRLMVLTGGAWACGQVAFWVGYGQEVLFRRAFERQTGLPPSAYRQQVRALHRLGRRPPDPAWIRNGWLAKLAAGELEPTQVLAVVAEIEAACEALSGVASEPAGFGSREEYERWLMARWWPRLRTLSAAELLGRLAQGFEIETPALCELLWSQIGNLGPPSARRGVELAELAFAQALKLARFLGAAEHSCLMARAWAWRGHARQNARDPAGAAVALLLAEHWLARHPPPAAVTAEVRRLETRLAKRVCVGDVVRFPTGARGGVAARVNVGNQARFAARYRGDNPVEPGGEGSPERAEARWRAGFGAGEDREGHGGEQHEEAETGEEARKAVARHGGSSLRAGAAPTTAAGAPGPGAEISPRLHPNRKPAPLCQRVPERLVAERLAVAGYRVRRDAARAPRGWRPIFEQLEQRLFDPRLRLKPLRQAHRLARPAATRAFEKVFGCEPGEYLTRRRIETVQALLPIEGLTVWACAERVGFTSPSGFEDAYKRLCGETPRETRARLAAAGKMVAPEPAAEGEAALRRLLTLQDPPEAVAAACATLRERGRAALRERASSLESWEQLVLDEWWERVRERPTPEPWHLLDGQLATAAAFETLCRASREEGRGDRQRGLEMATVALESLALLRGRLEPLKLAELEVTGLGELGNAYRHLHDFPAAEQAVAAAEQRLEAIGQARPELHADLLLHKAELYAAEHRLADALALTQRALALADGAPVLRAEILLVQGSLFDDLGQMDQTIAAFSTAFELLRSETAPFLAFAALQNLAIASHKIGDDAAARSWLERAEPIVRLLGQPRAMCIRDWLLGLLARNQGDFAQAELHLRRAHAGYERLKDLALSGVISLDLAALYLGFGQPAEAAQLAAEALPQLGSLGLAGEGIVALSLLHQALETEALSTAVLEKVRGCIARLVNAPELPQAGS